MARGPITFRDVVIEFFLHEWEFLNPLQKKLYCIVMMENYSNVVSIGHFISKPDIIVLLEEEKRPLDGCEGRNKKMEYRFGFKL